MPAKVAPNPRSGGEPSPASKKHAPAAISLDSSMNASPRLKVPAEMLSKLSEFDEPLADALKRGEIFVGVGTPKTIVELYEVVTQAMLRTVMTHSDADTLLPTVLMAIFFEAHLTEQRVITTEHLDAAARRLRKRTGGQLGDDGIRLIKERVLLNQMPLFSLLTAKPLTMRVAHLSFQEFYVACAVRDHAWRLTIEPWKFSAFWANAVKMGGEMGELFAKGLLKAAGFGRTLDLDLKLGGHRVTVLVAIQQLISGGLKRLSLRCSHLQSDGVAHVAEALKTNSTLHTLGLSNNGLCPDDGIAGGGLSVLGEALATNTTLRVLDLCSNGLGTKGWSTVFSALRDNKENKIESWNLSQEGIDVESSKLAEYVSVSTALTQLNLFDNSIGPEGTKCLAEALKNQETLTELNLDCNEIGNQGAVALGSALKTNSVLKTLHLYENKIEDKGAQPLGEALRTNSNLVELYLRGNRLHAKAAHLLASGLKENKALQLLDLSQNALCGINYMGTGSYTTEGTISMAEMLKVNFSLRSLLLSDNSMKSEGAGLLAEALRTNSSLTKLNLYNNGISDEGAKALGKAVKTNYGLTELNLQHNHLAEEAKELLRKAAGNRHLTLKL